MSTSKVPILTRDSSRVVKQALATVFVALLFVRSTHAGGPPNDLCRECEAIGEGSFSGTTLGANNDGSRSCGMSEKSPDVWYCYTAGCTGTATATTCRRDTNFDTVLSVHSGCPGEIGNEIVCNDDDCGLQSLVTWSVTSGTTYLIRVSGFAGASGVFELNVAVDCDCEPPECFIPFDDVLGGWQVCEEGEACPISLGPGGDAWLKHFLDPMGPNGMPQQGDTFVVEEHLLIGEGDDWTDWHEEITTPDWVWTQGTLEADDQVVEGTVAGASIWFDFPAQDPGTAITITKFMEYTGRDVFKGLQVDVEEFPTGADGIPCPTIFNEDFESGTFDNWVFADSTDGQQSGSNNAGSWSSTIVTIPFALEGEFSAELHADATLNLSPYRLDAAITTTVGPSTHLSATLRFDSIQGSGGTGHSFFDITIVDAANTSNSVTYRFSTTGELGGDVEFIVAAGEEFDFKAVFAQDYFEKFGTNISGDVVIRFLASADYAEDNPVGDQQRTTTVRIDTIIVSDCAPCESPALCDGDANGDGAVNPLDSGAILARFGLDPCDDDNCQYDVNCDGAINPLDSGYVLARFDTCDPVLKCVLNCTGEPGQPIGACCHEPFDGTCSVLTALECTIAGGTYAGDSTDCTDSDGDRIPDVFEENNCSDTATTPCHALTDPFNADTDGDGIEDGDEFYGTLDGLDLPPLGADPCKQDIFVECDWVYGIGGDPNGNEPHVNQVNRVVTAFANSGVPNPDNTTGITLHIDYGQPPYNGGNSVLDPNRDGTVDVDNDSLDNSEFGTIKSGNFASNRDAYFHYFLICDEYSIGGTDQDSSGLAELPGDDFLVSTGQWWTGDDNRIGHTIMHEFGHNLNLKHGGFEALNRKPNYNSIMNYRYQLCGVDTDGDAIPDDVADYSGGVYIDLDENALYEDEGVTGSDYIDWNDDGLGEQPYRLNINCRLDGFFDCTPLTVQPENCGTLGDCWDSTCDHLSDHDDWANLDLVSGLADADFAQPEIIFCDPL